MNNLIPKKTIAVESSTWNNIGDAFYQNSLIHQLRKLLPETNVVSFDGPFQRAFRPGRVENLGYDSRFRVDADHFVFSGPIVGSVFLKQYGPLIESIQERGKDYSLFSIHVSADGEDLRAIVEFLKRHPPAALHTRDNPSFEKLKGLAKAELDGICFAFLVREMEHLPSYSAGRDYVCVSYYRGPEPEISVMDSTSSNVLDAGINVQESAPVNQRYWKFARLLEHRRPHASELGKWEIIRPVHSFSRLPLQMFSKANSYISYNPDNFLAIYKECSCVLTDRVHAGVAALSFGKPALVERVDSRFALFEKLDIQRHGDFMTLAPEVVTPFKVAVEKWVTEDFVAAAKL